MPDILDMNTDFYEDLIYFAEQLEPRHPVFMLHGYWEDRVVIKQEAVSWQDIKHNARVMGTIDPNAKPKLLTAREVQALQNWVNLFRGDLDCGAGLIEGPLRMPGTWVKMQVFKLIKLESAANKADKKKGSGDKTDIRFIAATLNAPGGLEKLGEIVAADMFNGNSDRFYPFGQGRDWNGTRLKVLVNVGNVFISVDADQNGGVIGLDGIDPSSQYKDMTSTLQQSESAEFTDGEKGWPGRLLSRNTLIQARRMKFAQDIADDLNFVLGPRNRKIPFGSTQRLPTDAAARINAGMESGAQKIRLRLKAYREKNAGALPPGLSDRMAILGDP